MFATLRRLARRVCQYRARATGSRCPFVPRAVATSAARHCIIAALAWPSARLALYASAGTLGGRLGQPSRGGRRMRRLIGALALGILIALGVAVPQASAQSYGPGLDAGSSWYGPYASPIGASGFGSTGYGC